MMTFDLIKDVPQFSPNAAIAIVLSPRRPASAFRISQNNIDSNHAAC
jgi:hypothetical protein